MEYQIFSEARELFPYTQRMRRDFHSHPELGFCEFRTAGIVAQELTQLGMEVTPGVGKTGVVAILEGSAPGPVVMLRFDMDALPIVEQNDVSYKSQNEGVMHACGHDGHTSIGLTAAKLLAAHRGELAGSIKFVFQPAEEGQGGAAAMIADGVLHNPRPDVSFGLHVMPEKPVGWVGVTPGPVMAASEIFKIVISGKGSHGALPHQSIDPVYAAGQVITGLQSIVSRNVSPLEAAVISVTSVHGGEAYNVIPNTVELRGTLRTFNPGVREMLLQRFEQLVQGIVTALGCTSDIYLTSLTPAVINDPQATRFMQQVVPTALQEYELDTDFRSVVSEDMSLFLREIPGCFLFLGTANDQRGLSCSLHHPRFDIDETALTNGAALLVQAALNYLKP